MLLGARRPAQKPPPRAPRCSTGAPHPAPPQADIPNRRPHPLPDLRHVHLLNGALSRQSPGDRPAPHAWPEVTQRGCESGSHRHASYLPAERPGRWLLYPGQERDRPAHQLLFAASAASLLALDHPRGTAPRPCLSPGPCPGWLPQVPQITSTPSPVASLSLQMRPVQPSGQSQPSRPGRQVPPF